MRARLAAVVIVEEVGTLAVWVALVALYWLALNGVVVAQIENAMRNPVPSAWVPALVAVATSAFLVIGSAPLARSLVGIITDPLRSQIKA